MDKINSQIPFIAIVPVWGRAYTDTFVNYVMPLWLTEGNFVEFSPVSGDELVIVTTYEDSKIILNSSIYKKFETYIDIKIKLIDGIIDLSSTHAAMSQCYQVVISSYQSISPDGIYFLCLTPDAFWSKGTILKLRELVESGYELVAALSFRTAKETILSDLQMLIDQGSALPGLEVSAMVSLGLKHIHDLSAGHDVLSPSTYCNNWPSHQYWLGSEATDIIARCFHMHPLLFKVKKQSLGYSGTIDGEFLEQLKIPKEKTYVAKDNNDFFGIELTAIGRTWGDASYCDINRTIDFSLKEVTPLHWFYFSHLLQFRVCSDLEDSNYEVKKALQDQVFKKIINKKARSERLYKYKVRAISKFALGRFFKTTLLYRIIRKILR